MGIFGNMQVLSLLSWILTSLMYQRIGTVGVEEANNTIMGCLKWINLKLPFAAPKFRLRRV